MDNARYNCHDCNAKIGGEHGAVHGMPSPQAGVICQDCLHKRMKNGEYDHYMERIPCTSCNGLGGSSYSDLVRRNPIFSRCARCNGLGFTMKVVQNEDEDSETVAIKTSFFTEQRNGRI